MIFKIIFIHNLTSICYAYDIENPMVSYEIPLLVQLPSPEALSQFRDGYKMHKLDQIVSLQKRGAEKSLFSQLKSFLSHIDSQIEILCFKSHL